MVSAATGLGQYDEISRKIQLACHKIKNTYKTRKEIVIESKVNEFSKKTYFTGNSSSKKVVISGYMQ